MCASSTGARWQGLLHGAKVRWDQIDNGGEGWDRFAMDVHTRLWKRLERGSLSKALRRWRWARSGPGMRHGSLGCAKSVSNIRTDTVLRQPPKR
jgi:hypothetical protein